MLATTAFASHGAQAVTTTATPAPGALPGLPARTESLSAVMLLAVRLNGVMQDDGARVLMSARGAALAESDWANLHLKAPATPALRHDGENYQLLDNLPGLRWNIETASQTLVIDAPASAFGATTVGMDETRTVAATADQWGGFANYDLAWQRSGSATVGGRRDWSHALIEAGTFGPLGSGRVSSLVRDDGTVPRWVRLDSTWTVDRPAQMESLRIGDGISKAGAWGRPMRFGGIQWATDFSTQPGFLSFPLPAMRGEAALPSTLDVYVNNSKRATSQLPAGPFELNDLPIVTGSGQVRVVVRDLLGREQVIVQPYYTSAELLRPGLHSFSYELGAVREDYGLRSNEYGRLMASATDRLGITDTFTRELRAELHGNQASAGATGMWQAASVGMFSASGVVSHSPSGKGAMLAGSFERRDANWSGSLQVRGATRDFVQMGQGDEGAPRVQATLAGGGVVGDVSVGASLVHQRGWDGSAQRLLTLNLARSVGSLGSLGLFLLRDLASGSTTAAISLSVLLDSRTSLSSTVTSNRNVDGDASRRSGATTLQLQRSVAEERGLGYSIDATVNRDQGDTQRLTAQAIYQTDRADFNVGLAQSRSRNGSTAWATTTDAQASVSGGVAWLDNSVFLSRRIERSFAIVEVADYPDVQVLHDRHVVARTDANGRALVAGLRGYEANRIGVEAGDLPFDAEVEALEVDLTPPSRSGVVLRVPVRRSRSASLRLVDAKGVAIPAGSVISLVGRAQTFPVGMDGRSFVAGLAGSTPIRVRWPGGECGATLAIAANADSIDDVPELGTVSCK